MAGQSIAELERDAEIARADVARTVDHLRAQVSDTSEAIRARIAPQAIARNLAAYAEKNPLRAVAYGSLFAYPLLQLVRSIPLPVVLIGAGVILSSRRGGPIASGSEREPAGESQLEILRQQASDGFKSAKAMATDATVQVIDQLADSASETAQSARDKVSDLADAARSRMGATAEFVADTARASTAATAERLAGTGDRAKELAQASFDKTPLVFGGLALLAGVLIASALPTTETERKVTGETADELKRRAAAQAEQSFQSAKHAVSGIAADVAQRAAELGVTREDIGEGIERLGDKVAAVADAAITTAFEMPSEDHPSENSSR